MTPALSSLSRRAALGMFPGAALLAGASSLSAASEPKASQVEALDALRRRLAEAPRRRAFATTPFMTTTADQWDCEAAAAVLSYRNRSLQVWECTEIDAPWLNLMREAINAQVFAHANAGFLAVAAVHGTAHLALFDQAAWDTHSLASLAGGKAERNVFVAPKEAVAPSDDIQDIERYYGPSNNNIHTLQERGAVFIACHDSIHAIARAVRRKRDGASPSADAIAADLTNHLVTGAVLVPSVVAFLVELQRAGFTYAKGG